MVVNFKVCFSIYHIFKCNDLNYAKICYITLKLFVIKLFFKLNSD